ncbi:hypothetical protein C8Q79DRAFT_1013487 [Trametes meyenii]|nr:hypothetical protein C8Q79DRAFT_1013487 [Trametes meyenii]
MNSSLNEPQETPPHPGAYRTSLESGSEQSRLRPITPTSVHSTSSELGDIDTIPPYDPTAPRTLILCFDGTGNQFDTDNSNVIKFFTLLKKDDRREQMVYYQTGIGTYTSPQVTSAIGRAASKTLDEMVAWNLDTHVTSGYKFLMQNYEAGDKICLFGFSRGAYTARALAGMLHKVGLLPTDNHQQVPFAYKMYSRTDDLGWKQSTVFKKAFSVDVNIDFIGVWDTVCSVGIIPRRLPFTASNTAIRTFRHALSLDERRAKFRANHYHRPSQVETLRGTHPGDMPRPSRRTAPQDTGKLAKAIKARLQNAGGTMAQVSTETVREGPRESIQTEETVVVDPPTKTAGTEGEDSLDAPSKDHVSTDNPSPTSSNSSASRSGLLLNAVAGLETLREKMRKKRSTVKEREFDKAELVQGETDVKEVWFAGCHCDVGGGSVPDEKKHALARIPLRWMVRECFRTKTGIRFHGDLLKQIGLDPATLWPDPPPANEWSVDEFVYPGDAPVSPAPSSTASSPLLPLPKPTVNVTVATPLEMSREEIDRAESAAGQALNAAPQAGFPATSPDSPPIPSIRVHRETRVGDMPPSTAQAIADGLANHVLHGPPLPPLTPPGWGPDPDVDELQEEREDAKRQIYDQLSKRPFWWLLELSPVEHNVQCPESRRWDRYYRFNLGRGREVPQAEKFYVHRSVKYRMDQESLKGTRGRYQPRARFGSLKPTYVD